MVYAEMSTAEATTTFDAWTTPNQNLQMELDIVKAEVDERRVAAEQTTKSASDEIAVQRAACVSRTGRWFFFALLIRLLGA
jgi:hypothetical protein